MTKDEERTLDGLDEALRPGNYDPKVPQRARDLAERLRNLLDGDETLVDLGTCIGAACIREHGTRIATRRGTGPASIYILCDECFDTRLEAEAKPHMVEVRGVAWIRHLGLHTLHHGKETG